MSKCQLVMENVQVIGEGGTYLLLMYPDFGGDVPATLTVILEGGICWLWVFRRCILICPQISCERSERQPLVNIYKPNTVYFLGRIECKREKQTNTAQGRRSNFKFQPMLRRRDTSNPMEFEQRRWSWDWVGELCTNRVNRMAVRGDEYDLEYQGDCRI